MLRHVTVCLYPLLKAQGALVGGGPERIKSLERQMKCQGMPSSTIGMADVLLVKCMCV